MGAAFLALHEATGDRAWLDRSAAAARFTGGRFALNGAPGFRSAAPPGPAAAPLAARPGYEDNVAAARWLAALHRATKEPAHLTLAERALRWLNSWDTAGAVRIRTAGALLADEDYGEAVEAPGRAGR